MIEYLLSCIVMGIGIGADVCMATIANVRNIDSDSRRIWVSRVTLTHTVFPMFGYYGFATLYRLFPEFGGLLGAVACVVIAIFLWRLFCSWLTPDTDDTFKGDIAWYSWPVVLAVSFDAFYSGPAKSVQAIGWTPGEIAASFFLSGLVVLLMTLAVSEMTIRWKRRRTSNRDAQGVYLDLWLMFTEFSILSYFFWLTLARYVLRSDLHFAYVAILSLLVTLTLFSSFQKRLVRYAESACAGASASPC